MHVDRVRRVRVIILLRVLRELGVRAGEPACIDAVAWQLWQVLPTALVGGGHRGLASRVDGAHW